MGFQRFTLSSAGRVLIVFATAQGTADQALDPVRRGVRVADLKLETTTLGAGIKSMAIVAPVILKADAVIIFAAGNAKSVICNSHFYPQSDLARLAASFLKIDPGCQLPVTAGELTGNGVQGSGHVWRRLTERIFCLDQVILYPAPVLSHVFVGQMRLRNPAGRTSHKCGVVGDVLAQLQAACQTCAAQGP